MTLGYAPKIDQPILLVRVSSAIRPSHYLLGSQPHLRSRRVSAMGAATIELCRSIREHSISAVRREWIQR
jgi:hypothetical protein